MLDTDPERKFYVDSMLEGKSVRRSEDGVLEAFTPLREIEVGDDVFDLSELPSGWFDSDDESYVSSEISQMLGG